MPFVRRTGAPVPVPLPPPGTPVVKSQSQPVPIQYEYIDPDGVSWDLSNLDMSDGFIATDVIGMSGIPVSLASIPLVRGGSLVQQLYPQPRMLTIGLFVMSTDNADGQDAYLDLLDAITTAFWNLRADMPVPGILRAGRPDGTWRQCQVYTISGLDQPNLNPNDDGELFTTFALQLEAPDPFLYDSVAQAFTFSSPNVSTTLATYDFEDGTDGWTASGSGSPAVAQSNAWSSSGLYSLRLNGDGTNANPTALSPLLAVSPGQVLTYKIDLDTNVSLATSPNAQLVCEAFAPDGVTLVSTTFSANLNIPATTQQTRNMTYAVPTDGSIGFVKFGYRITGTPPNTDFLYGDDVLIVNMIGFLPLLPVALTGASSFGDVTITNDGKADAYPVWTLTGPGTPTVENVTTGRSFTLSTPLADNQVVVVNTMPGQQSVIDQGSGDDLWSKLVIDTPRDLWALVPGDNEVSVTVTSATTDTAINMSFLRRWLRA